MAKVVQKAGDATPKKPRSKPKTEEAREKRMIALAVNLAEEQLRNGTASSQIISHYLRLGTKKEHLEIEIKEKEKDLIVAKTEAIKSAKRVEELYANALSAFRSYNGEDPDEDEDL